MITRIPTPIFKYFFSRSVLGSQQNSSEVQWLPIYQLPLTCIASHCQDSTSECYLCYNCFGTSLSLQAHNWCGENAIKTGKISKEKYGLSKDKKSILMFNGSLGSSTMNAKLVFLKRDFYFISKVVNGEKF